MEFFVDTADVSEIHELNEYGLLDGVTTNPSIIAKSGRDFKEVIADICKIVDGPVSAEVAATNYEGMVAEGEHLAKIADNVTVKLPLTLPGLKACRHFAKNGIKTNVTLCFSANQALLAAKAGATYVSPFLGRLDDINLDGVDLIRDIRQIVKEVALAGSDTATMPPAVIRALANHPLTENGLTQFVADWTATGQSIL